MHSIAKIIKTLFYAAVILVGVTFALSNRAMVDLKFYPVPYQTTMPLFLFTILIFGLGLFLGWSIARVKTIRYKRAQKQANKRVAALENELVTLRTERLTLSAVALPRQ